MHIQSDLDLQCFSHPFYKYQVVFGTFSRKQRSLPSKVSVRAGIPPYQSHGHQSQLQMALRRASDNSGKLYTTNGLADRPMSTYAVGISTKDLVGAGLIWFR